MRIDEQIILLNIQNRVISSNTVKHAHKLIIVWPLSLFYWPLCCLVFFDLRILITPLLSSNCSWYKCELSNWIISSVCFSCGMSLHYISISGKPEKQNNSIIAIKRHLNWTYNVLIIRKNVLLVMWRIRVLITWHRAHDMISFNVFSILTLS